MNKKSTSVSFDEGTPITQSDIKSGNLVLRKRDTNGVILSNKQRINIYLDSAIVEHFRAMAGERDYQTLINDALKQGLQAESIESKIKKLFGKNYESTKSVLSRGNNMNKTSRPHNDAVVELLRADPQFTVRINPYNKPLDLPVHFWHNLA